MDLTSNIREKLGRLASTAMVAGLLVVSLAACGGNDTPTVPAPTATATTAASASTDGNGSTSGGSEQEAKATLKEWAIDLSSTDVSAGKVKYTVTNDGQFVHDLVVLDASGNSVGATTKFDKGKNPQTLEVDLKPGTYTFLCDLAGHAEKGMQTKVTVK